MSIRLRHLVDIGPRPKKTLPANLELSFAPMEALKDGLGGLSEMEVKPASLLVTGSYNYFEEGDVLLAKVTPCFENGKKALAVGLKNGAGFATSEVHVIRPKYNKIDTRFLLYLLSSENFRAEGMASMTGAGGLRRVSEAAILNHRPKVIDLATQRRIADFLDRETARIGAIVNKIGAVSSAKGAAPGSLLSLLFEKRSALITAAVTGQIDVETYARSGNTDRRIDTLEQEANA